MRWPTGAWIHCAAAPDLAAADTMKKLHTVLVALGLAGAVGAAWWLQNRPAAVAGAGTAAAGAALGAASGTAARGAAAGPGGGAVGGAGAGAAGAGGPIAVEVGRVERVRLEDDAQAVGTLRSNQGIVLRPEVSGRIVKLGFGDGQRVKRGQLLVQLDGLVASHAVEWHWVRGHNGDPGNERADALANRGVDSLRRGA